MADLSNVYYVVLRLAVKGLKKLQPGDLDTFQRGIEKQGHLKVFDSQGTPIVPTTIQVIEQADPATPDSVLLSVWFASTRLANSGKQYQYTLEDPLFRVKAVGGAFAGLVDGFCLGTADETVTLVAPDRSHELELTLTIANCDHRMKSAFWQEYLRKDVFKLFYKGQPVAGDVTVKGSISDDDTQRRIWIGVPQLVANPTDYSWRLQAISGDAYRVQFKQATGNFHAPVGADVRVVAQGEAALTLSPPSTGIPDSGLSILFKCGTPDKAKQVLEQVFKPWGVVQILDASGKAIKLGTTPIQAKQTGASVMVILPTDYIPPTADGLKAYLKNSTLNLDRLEPITMGKPLVITLNDQKVAHAVSVKGTVQGAKAGLAVGAVQKFLPGHAETFHFPLRDRTADAKTDAKGHFTMPATFLTYDSPDRSAITFSASGQSYQVIPSPTATVVEVTLNLDGSATAKNGVVMAGANDKKSLVAPPKPAQAAKSDEQELPTSGGLTAMTPEKFAEQQEAILKKLPIVKGFYSKAEATIAMANPASHQTPANQPKLPISDFRWARTQGQNPIYGFASVLYDYLAYGTTIVSGNFILNVGDYNAIYRAISNANPFGHHYGDTFDITIYVGDDQFHRGIQEWYVQSIHILGARLVEEGNSKELSGETDTVMYSFIARDVAFGVAERKSDSYRRPTSEQLAAADRVNLDAPPAAEGSVDTTDSDGASGQASSRYVLPSGVAQGASVKAPRQVNQRFEVQGSPFKPVYLDIGPEGAPAERIADIPYQDGNMGTTVPLVEGKTYRVVASYEADGGRREERAFSFTVTAPADGDPLPQPVTFTN